MKKTTILITMLLSGANFSILNAQNSSFDLKSYKTTNYKRSSLDLQFDMNENESNSYNKEFADGTTNFNAKLNLKSSFSNRTLSEKRITEYSATLSTENSFNKSWNPQTDSTTRINQATRNTSNSYLSGYYDDNFYYSPSHKNYFKIGAAAYAGIDYFHYKSLSNETETSPNISTNMSLNIGHGHGRVEYVEDAVEALYILNDLSSNGLLSRSYTENDIKEFADKITLLRKERFFDTRLYKQKVMKELVAFLEDNQLINNGNIDVFNIVSDYHFMAGIEPRPSGKQLEYYANPQISHTKVKRTEFEETTSSEWVRLVLGYSFYQPISIKWQQNISANLTVSQQWSSQTQTASNNTTNNSTNISRQSGILNASYAIGYYPNTRTSCTASINAMYDLSHRKNYSSENHQFESNIHSLCASIGINAHYYLSERLRLSGNFNLSPYNARNNEKANGETISKYHVTQLIHRLSVSLTYCIF